MLSVMVTGSRSWADESVVHAALDEASASNSYGDLVVMHGACRTGADAHAKRWCELDGRPDTPFPPASGSGRRGLLDRNLAMVAASPDLVLAFVDPSSSGTWHALTAAIVARLPVRTFGSQVADEALADRARLAASTLLADGGWRIARRKALAVSMASLRPGEKVAPGLVDAIDEQLAKVQLS